MRQVRDSSFIVGAASNQDHRTAFANERDWIRPVTAARVADFELGDARGPSLGALAQIPRDVGACTDQRDEYVTAIRSLF